MTEEEKKAQAAAAGAQETPKGRAAILAAYRTANPDAEEEVGDDALWDYAHGIAGERDKFAEINKKYQDRDKRWMDLYEKDPRWGMFSALYDETGDAFYAIGRAFPDFEMDASEEERESYFKGRKEEMARLQEHRQKLEGLKGRFKERCNALDMPEETAEKANLAFIDFVNAALDGDIPDELIDSFLKGVDYDDEKAAALEAARQEGKREAIEGVKGHNQRATSLPDLGAGKSANKNGGAISFEDEGEKRKSFTEMVAEDEN